MHLNATFFTWQDTDGGTPEGQITVLRWSGILALVGVALFSLSMTLARAQDAPATACDTYAASPLDPQRKTTGVAEEKINPVLAIPACMSALRSFPRSPRLKYQLGRAYRKANNFREAIAWFRQAAQYGYAPAEAVLGYMSQFGEGIPQNYLDAISWYTKAASHGFAPAQNNLGMIYENALGVSKNLEVAITWYRRAAEQGHLDAQKNLKRLEQAEIIRKQEEERVAREAAKKREEEAAATKREAEAARTTKAAESIPASQPPSQTNVEQRSQAPAPPSYTKNDWPTAQSNPYWTVAWILSFLVVGVMLVRWITRIVKSYKIRRPVGADDVSVVPHSNFFIRVFGRRIPVRKAFIILLDESDNPIRVKSVSCYLVNKSAIVIFCEKASVRLEYELRHDILAVTTNVDERQYKEVGKTFRRMALTGIATGLIRGGEHPGLAGLGGALLDYRMGGTETRTTFTGFLHIVFRDLSTIDVRCGRSKFERLCSVLPQQAFSTDRLQSANEALQKVRRMAIEGPRVCTELAKNVADLKAEIETVAKVCETATTFQERNEARSKLERMREQLSLQQVSLHAVRCLCSDGALIQSR